MASETTVSILCLTYNQAKYIRQTLDSFLMQQTDFKYEVLINDDASDDGTQEIIREYQKKHPEIIKPIFHEKNLFSQGIRNMVGRFLLPKAQGRYIALCEGDDYWTDLKKLQMQVDFLEKRPSYALCFHPVHVIFEDDERKDSVYPSRKTKEKFNLNYLLRHNFIQTNSVMYRKQHYSGMATNITPSDWYLHLYHAQFGKIGFINRVMSVYRVHRGGIWYDSHNNRDENIKKHGLRQLNMYFEILKLYGKNPTYRKIVYDKVDYLVNLLITLDKKNNLTLVRQAIREFPENIEMILLNQNSRSKQQAAELKSNTKKMEKLNQEIQAKQQEIQAKQQEIQAIKSSKAWKIRNKVSKTIGREVV